MSERLERLGEGLREWPTSPLVRRRLPLTHRAWADLKEHDLPVHAAGSARTMPLPLKGVGVVHLQGPAREPAVPPHPLSIFFGDPSPRAASAAPATEKLGPRKPVQARKESAVKCVPQPQRPRGRFGAVHGGSRGEPRSVVADLGERTPPFVFCISLRGNHCGSSPVGPRTSLLRRWRCAKAKQASQRPATTRSKCSPTLTASLAIKMAPPFPER